MIYQSKKCLMKQFIYSQDQQTCLNTALVPGIRKIKMKEELRLKGDDPSK